MVASSWVVPVEWIVTVKLKTLPGASCQLAPDQKWL
jgi:hypothetical protein